MISEKVRKRGLVVQYCHHTHTKRTYNLTFSPSFGVKRGSRSKIETSGFLNKNKRKRKKIKKKEKFSLFKKKTMSRPRFSPVLDRSSSRPKKNYT